MPALRLVKPGDQTGDLAFLSKQQKRLYGDLIEAYLDDYPPEKTPVLLQEALTPHFRGAYPDQAARRRLQVWRRLQRPHAMIVAACVIIGLQSDVKSPFAYAEHLIRQWTEGASEGSVRSHGSDRTGSGAGALLLTHAEVVAELNKYGEGTRMGDLFERVEDSPGGKPRWRRK